MSERKASIKRETGETRVTIELNIDGTGDYQIQTGLGMLDHLLAQMAKHGLFDITLGATGDLKVDEHHTVEDIAISLGKALSQALGERRGISRMGHAIVPMDEALALAAVDISGRGYVVVEAEFIDRKIGDLPSDLVGHFLQSLASEARLNLHVRLFAGANDHHKAEAIFKALGRALNQATRLEERLSGRIPSTKGHIET